MFSQPREFVCALEDCDQVFTSLSARATYCGHSCRNKAYRRRHPKVRPARTCEGCGGEYAPRTRTQRFCSPSCVSRPLTERHCRTCGKHFAPRCNAHLYCAPDCRPSAMVTSLEERTP